MIEVLVILIYAVVFYRYWSKRRLIKTMDLRDRARSDLYLAQLRSQTAPNTPGFTPYAPYTPGPPKSPFVSTIPEDELEEDDASKSEKGEYYPTQYATARGPTKPLPTFQLQQPPPARSNTTPKAPQGSFPTPAAPAGNLYPSSDHTSAAPGEPTYDAVPIPGAYERPAANISLPPPVAYR